MSNRMRFLLSFTSVMALVFSFLFGTPFFSLYPNTPPETHVDAVWIDQLDGLPKVPTADGRLLFIITEAGDVAEVVADRCDGRLCSVSGKTSLFNSSIGLNEVTPPCHSIG